MTKEKKSLAKCIRDWLKTNKEYDQKRLAQDVGLTHANFRTQLHNNKYTDQTLEAITRILGIKTEAYYYTKINPRGRKNIPPQIELLKDQIDVGLKRQKDFEHSGTIQASVKSVYDSLGKDSLVVICSINEDPLEFIALEGNGLFGSVCKNISEENTHFVYLRPNNDVLYRYRKFQIFTNDVDASYYDFCSRISKELQGTQAGEVDSIVKKRIFQVRVNNLPFWGVGLRWGFYSYLSNNGRRHEMFVRIPASKKSEGFLHYLPEDSVTPMCYCLYDLFYSDKCEVSKQAHNSDENEITKQKMGLKALTKLVAPLGWG